MSYLGSKMKSHILFSCFDFSVLNNSLMGVILHFQLKKSNNLSLGKLTQKKLVVLIQKIFTSHYYGPDTTGSYYWGHNGQQNREKVIKRSLSKCIQIRYYQEIRNQKLKEAACQGHTISKGKVMNKSRKFTPRYHLKMYSPYCLLSMHPERTECLPFLMMGKLRFTE